MTRNAKLHLLGICLTYGAGFGCASFSSNARRTLIAAADFSNDATRALAAYDQTYQDSVLYEAEKTGDKAAAKSKIITYRERRAKATLALAELQTLIAFGKPLVAFVEQGTKTEHDLVIFIGTLADAVTNCRSLLYDLGALKP